MKLVSTRLKSSSACAYTTPNTASASVLPYTCGMPQLSRMMVMFCACFSSVARSLSAAAWPAHEAQRTAAARMKCFMTRDCSLRELLQKPLRPLRHGLEPLDLHLRAAAKIFEHRRREHREIDVVRAPVGPAAVLVRELVFARELPRAVELTRPLENAPIRGERRHAAPDEQRRLRL